MNSDETQTQEHQQQEIEVSVNPEDSTPKDEAVTEAIESAIAQPMAEDLSIASAAIDESAVQPITEGESAADPNPISELLTDITDNVTEKLVQQTIDLQQQQQELKQEVETMLATKANLQQELSDTQAAIGRLVQEALGQLEQRKQSLQIEVEKLERRRDRIQKEMRTTFAGVSQDLAIRVQGFKDYLVGSLQDLASTAEQLDLVPEVQEQPKQIIEESRSSADAPANPRFTEQGFQEQAKQIRRILDQYRTLPDYYGPPWQLRRTFEPIHAEKVSNWFFTQGGKGALRTMGSRLQNILISSTVISVLRTLYGGRLRTLVLANSPERLGEWRRGLQDCLGITRNDFGPERGIILFEAAEDVAQKADRLVKEGKLPLIIIDETEDQISLSMLQFPLWLAFAPDPQNLMPKDF
ncbi:DUF3086 domain-containing protein [Kamptonema animale CS-326]|jgi:hypothetical protein|uniref:DUF3086 domain-containing protein n=1 Tax=Kamptonema animale TaxID=92934 RepID=UPI00232E9E58|nr:DUF3086 domain-containing protein [Kamptonema animale]MDB9512871.1 DUF3086 domain-containing protein [Kamptonema animale CS-326]